MRILRWAWVGIILWSGATLVAKAAPRGEVFGGFSLLQIGASDDFQPLAARGYGWQWSAGLQVHRNLSLVADYGGQLTGAAPRQPIQPYPGVENPEGYGPGFSLPRSVGHEYLVGPQISTQLGHANPFVHALFGGSIIRGSAESGTESRAGLTMAIGGGLDFTESDNPYALRIQMDWLPVRPERTWFNKTLRFGVGVVYKWGS